MDQMGLTRKDLTKYIGSISKVSEVLSRKRPLSLPMIRRLHQGMDIPVNILIEDAEAHSLEVNAKTQTTANGHSLLRSHLHQRGDRQERPSQSTF